MFPVYFENPGYKNRLWIMGGWFNSYASPPRDVWSTADGKSWNMVTKKAAWKHSDFSMAAVFKDQMFFMGGWYNGRLPDHSASNQVWASKDGANWKQVTKNAGWSPRIASGLVVFKDKLWMLGGTEDYYFGNEKNLKNDVWSSIDGKTWKRETANAGWSPRAYLQVVVFNGKIYVKSLLNKTTLFGSSRSPPETSDRNSTYGDESDSLFSCRS